MEQDFLRNRNLNLQPNMNPLNDGEIDEMVKIAFNKIYNKLFEK